MNVFSFLSFSDITVGADGKVTCVDDKEGELPDPAVRNKFKGGEGGGGLQLSYKSTPI